MANLSGFRTMLTEYAGKGAGLPCVALKQDNEFGQAFGRIVTVDNRRSGETDAMLVGRYVDEICASLADESNAGSLKVFEHLCDAFAAKVKAAWGSIGAVRDLARELACSMDKLANSLMQADGYIESHANYSSLSQDFPSFTWGGLNAMGSIADIVKAVHGLAAPGNENVPTEVDKRIFDIVIANIQKFVTLKKVTGIKEEDRAAFVEAAQKFASGTPAATVVDIIDLVLGIKSFTEIFNSLKYVNTEVTKDFFRNLRRLDSFISDVFPVVDAISTDTIKTPENIKAEVIGNAMSLCTFCRIAAYYEHMMRHTLFREAFLLQDGMLNEDNRAGFEEGGGKPEMIATYIRKMYGDKREEIPALGIKGTTIIQAYGNIAEAVKDDMKEVERKVALARTTARVTAFVRVARDFLSRQEDIGAYKDRSTFVDSKMKEYGMCIADTIRQYNINFVDACMSLIVKTEYPGTFVEVMHDKLGVAYLAMLNDSNGEVGEDEICCAEVGVITDLVSEYVVDNFLELCSVSECVTPSALQNAQVNSDGTTPAATPEEATKDNPAATPAVES